MQEKILQLLNQLIELTANQTAQVLIDRLMEILNFLYSLFEKYEKDDPHITWTEFNKYNRLQKELDAIDELLKGAYSEIIDLIRDSEANIGIESYYRHMHMFDMTSNIDFINDGALFEQARSAINQPIEKIKLDKTFNNHRKATIKRIKGHLATGVLQGKSYDDIANDIKNDIGMSARQSKRVARTEVGRAQSEAQLAAESEAIELGANIVGYWDATLDLRTRSSHAYMDGKETDADGNFTVGLSKGPAPRLLIGEDSAAQNINCRCKKLYKVNGIKPRVRKARDIHGKSVEVPYQSYEEWYDTLIKNKEKIQQENARKQMKEMLKNGTITLEINPEKQNRHTLGHTLYEDYKMKNIAKEKPIPSYFDIPFEELNRLYEQNKDNMIYLTKSNGEWSKKAYIDFNKEVGTVIQDDKIIKTSLAKIHFSKTGTHLVPYVRKER